MSLSDAIIEGWQELGACRDKEAIEAARLQLHWAAQAVSSVGTTLLRPLPDFSHTNLEWIADRRMLAGQPTDDAARVRAALNVGEFSLALLNQNGGKIDELDLDGTTVGKATTWLGAAVGKVRGRDAIELKRPEHELPEFPGGAGKPFAYTSEEPLRELGRWFHNANAVLRVLFQREDDATPPRCWPHHFDLACLVSLNEEVGEHARTVGVGMTPGDKHYDEPYWYVTPWPYPKDLTDLPPIGEGLWHREGWVGAVLPLSRIKTDKGQQLAQVTNFLDLGIDACKKMLGS
jgi:hypothetical protein